jgi:hypothetical protein
MKRTTTTRKTSPRLAQSASAAPKVEGRSFAPPYPPSWFDRLADWVGRLPGPSWAFYIGLALVIFLIETLVQWQTMTMPWGKLLPTHAAMASSVIALGLGHYLKGYAGRAFDSYRSSLLADPDEAQGIRYQLTVMTRRGAWLALLAGAAFGLIGALLTGVPFMRILFLATTPTSWLLNGLLALAIWGTFFTVLYMILRQLRIVSRLYSNRTRVDLFALEPLYALTGLTARAAISFLVLPTLFVSVAPAILDQPVSLAIALAGSSLAAATFLMPLAGMHRLLVAEKARRLAGQSRRMLAALEDLHRRVDQGQLRQMDDLYKAIASLDLEKTTLTKIPTWPWEPGSIRGVAAALVLPLAIWLFQQVLQPLLAR